MPRKRNLIPSLLHHRSKAKGYFKDEQGKPIYIPGHWPADQIDPPPSVRREFDRLLAEYLQRGRRAEPPADPSSLEEQGQGSSSSAGLSIAELISLYWDHAQRYYRSPEGEPTGELENIRHALRPLNYLYGSTPAEEFGPKRLKAIQQLLTVGYIHPEHGRHKPLCRSLINSRINLIRRMVKWGVSEELVSPGILHGLQAVSGLPKGRSAAREAKPILPVDEAIVGATLPFLPTSPRGMVRLQLLTGMRPGELCRLSIEQIDRAGPVWIYRPRKHKTRHHARERTVVIGPRAQSVLIELVAIRCPCCGAEGRPPRIGSRDNARCGPCTDHHDENGIAGPFPRIEVQPPDAPLFSPARDREESFIDKRAARKTKVQPSQVNRKRAKPKRVPGEVYVTSTYNKAIKRAAAAAGVQHWHVNQLRHTRATAIRKAYGLEGAQVILGHSRADVTQIYAERDLSLAERIAREIG